MENILLVLNVIIAVILVLLVLLQKSEGGALGIGVSQDNFMLSRSAGGILTKVTAIIANLFILTSISLTVISNQGIPSSSVLEKTEEKEDSSEPQIPKSD